MNPHESAFVESFVVKARRERALEFLASSKNRHKFTSKFDHHGRNYFIPECIRSIEPRFQHPPNIAEMLRAMGAPERCHFIGGERDGEDAGFAHCTAGSRRVWNRHRALLRSGEAGLL
jgi:hypothetical protein